jgi:26S proteasome regulatory subunit N1
MFHPFLGPIQSIRWHSMKYLVSTTTLYIKKQDGHNPLHQRPFEPFIMAPKEDEKAITVTVETSGKDKKDSKKKKDDAPEQAMSEEDLELKERLETCVSTLLNVDAEASVTVPIRRKALDVIVLEVRTATSSMTSVPKPLKFLRPHFDDLKGLHATLVTDETVVTEDEFLTLRALLADVLSVLAMTLGDHGRFCTFGMIVYILL